MLFDESSAEAISYDQLMQDLLKCFWSNLAFFQEVISPFFDLLPKRLVCVLKA